LKGVLSTQSSSLNPRESTNLNRWHQRINHPKSSGTPLPPGAEWVNVVLGIPKGIQYCWVSLGYPGLGLISGTLHYLHVGPILGKGTQLALARYKQPWFEIGIGRQDDRTLVSPCPHSSIPYPCAHYRVWLQTAADL
jgi:hypothetical protein